LCIQLIYPFGSSVIGILKVASVAYSLCTKARTTMRWAADAEICKSFKLTAVGGGVEWSEGFVERWVEGRVGKSRQPSRST